jgi:hypothetical protein
MGRSLGCSGFSRGHRKNLFQNAKQHRGTRSGDFAADRPILERFGRPEVVAIEADVFPAEWSNVGEKRVGHKFALGAKLGDSATEIDGSAHETEIQVC